MGEAEAEMTNEKPLGRSRPSSRPHVRAVGQRNGESNDKRSPDRETKRAILDHDSQWSAVERHRREGRQSRSGLSVWRARAVTGDRCQATQMIKSIENSIEAVRADSASWIAHRSLHRCPILIRFHERCFRACG